MLFRSLSTGGEVHTKNDDSAHLHAEGLGRETGGGGEGEAVGEMEEMGRAGGGAGSTTKVFDTSQDTHTDTHTHTHIPPLERDAMAASERHLSLTHTRTHIDTEAIVFANASYHFGPPAIADDGFPYPSPHRGVPSSGSLLSTPIHTVTVCVAVCCSVLQRVKACCGM